MQDENRPAERKTLDERNRMTELQRIRHSCAHIMATAVTRLWPDALLDIGPPTDEGFYYDFDVQSHRFSPEDFGKIELDEWLKAQEEARKRDHRKIGKEMGLFTISPLVGPGLILWMPKGGIIRTELGNLMQEELTKRGYAPVFTPHIGHVALYKISGHFPYYKDSQYPTIKGEGDEEYLLKPMNCPHHIQIYAAEPRSYRDLPIRLAEFGTVYRYEQSGELSGMTRVRGFCQDDAHLFCTPEQVEQEMRTTVELVQHVFSVLGLTNYRVQVSLRDPKSDKYTGDPKHWEQAEETLQRVAKEMGLVHETVEGDRKSVV